ncbi:Mitochondrial carrier family [Zostera marina]|uniref:Mitochondrial carrier family n=1 Tax=Zostera marina TaxID=29655 RepID=A0A0K9Q5I4_ZOSMR|nr:Mitochondrial carrier family [Zostera marina]
MSNAVANGLAGAGGGIIAQILTYPLQTVNTRQQTERIDVKTAKKKEIRGSSGDRGEERSILERGTQSRGTLLQVLQVIRTEGWGGLYSGLKPSLFGTATSQGIYYYFYQIFKNRAEYIAASRKRKGKGDGTVGMFSWLLVAAVAGCLNVLCTNPIWVLVTRMQTQTQAERKIMERKRQTILMEASENFAADLTPFEEKLAKHDALKPIPYGTIRAATEVYSESGIFGFWKGIVPTLMMVCNPSIQFMIYETSLKRLKSKRTADRRGVKNVSAWEVFLLGALAKLGATVTTYPLLVVKSRLQAKQEIGGDLTHRYTGTLDAILKIFEYEGFRGFYKGMGTKIIQSVFGASVIFMVKEEFVKAYLAFAEKKTGNSS